MSKASDVVAIALSQIGYKEKATNSNLDDFTANSGDANWTKYARDLNQAGYYNGNKNGYAWCDVFVDWCFYKAFGDKAQEIQCQTGNGGASCTCSKSYYTAQGRCDKTPKVGDQVFFQSNGGISHTGLVVEVNDTTIVTIEGNSGNQVKKNTYQLTNSYIDSFGHPKYDEEDTSATETATQTKTAQKVPVWVTLEKLSYGSTGPQVKAVQRLLTSAGIASLELDGEFGPLTQKAVIQFQKNAFPDTASEWDGVVGTKTWTAILTTAY